MPEIRDRFGNVIKRSRNSRGIREYVSKNIVKVLAIDAIGEKKLEGKLLILFENGASYEANWASFEVLKDAVRRWRNTYGAALLVNGVNCGDISYDNPVLSNEPKRLFEVLGIEDCPIMPEYPLEAADWLKEHNRECEADKLRRLFLKGA